MLNNDFKLFIDYDYEIELNCSSECNIDPISTCRCSKITNVSINDIDLPKICNEIYKIYFSDDKINERDYKLKKIIYGYDKQFDVYIIDRIIRFYQLWNRDSYDITIFNGYYGEEIESIVIKTNISSRISSKIEEVLKLDSIKKRLESLLDMEYGYIIPEMIDKEYEIKVISKSKIHFGNKKHHNSVKEKPLEFYSDRNYNGIRGIVYQDGEDYRVIDGYHRIHTTNKTDILLINVKG